MSILTRAVAQTTALILASTVGASAQGHRIDTLAGAGPDQIPALSFGLGSVRSVAADRDGNVFIGSFDYSRIFRVDRAGILTAAVGNGGNGSGGGDGGSATDATLGQPGGIALDSAGNLFFVDGSDRVRRVDAATRVITTVAGGLYGFSGDGGPAQEAALSNPVGIALNGDGDLFIADRGNQRIRRVDAGTGFIATVAGTGNRGYSGDPGPATEADLSDPAAVAVDLDGNLLIADSGNHRIRRVNQATGQIETIAGNGLPGFGGDGGPAIEASFANPTWLTVDAAGDLVVTDTTNHRVRRISAGIVSTVAGSGDLGSEGDGGPAVGASMGPAGIVIDPDGNLLVADGFGRRVRRVDASTAVIVAFAGNGGAGSATGDGGPALPALLAEPSSLALAGNADLFIADRGDNRVRRVERTTGIITTVAGNGTSPSSGDGGQATDAGFNGPTGLAVDEGGNLFVVDQGAHKIRRVDVASGVITTIAGSGTQGLCGHDLPALEACFNGPWGLTADAAGNLFVADTFNNRVARYDVAAGTVTTVAGNGSQGYSGDGGAATQASLALPMGVAVDREGRFLYIADSFNFRVRRVNLSTGIIRTLAGDGNSAGSYEDGVPATSISLALPWGLALDAENNLLITDAPANQIKKVVVSTGLIYRVAGAGSVGFAGDGGLALDAVLNQPTSAVGDSDGNLFIADQMNHRVRRVTNAPPFADAGPDQTVPKGSRVHLDGAASFDPDEDTLGFEWRDESGSVVGRSAAIDVPVSAGAHIFALTVSDGWGGRAVDSVTVTGAKIKVESPEEDARWRVGSSHAIRWEHNLGAGTTVRIELSRDAGRSWEILAASVPNTDAQTESFGWVVTGPRTNKGRVRLTWVEGPEVSDRSGEFAIR